MISWMRRLAALFLFTLACYYIAKFCNQQTNGFAVARIYSELPHHSEWETPPLSNEQKDALFSLLNQKFYYLGCGGQCFAFASEDQTTVIKFFKHKVRWPFTFFLQLPLPDVLEKKRQKKWEKILTKLDRDFTSYKLAYEMLREETGLLYLHLNKTEDLQHTITIIDKLGIAHRISLDEVEFIVQRKGELAYPHIARLMDQGDIAGATQSVRSLLHIVVTRCQKGIFDEDARMHRNFGFIGSQPFFIDVGRFRKDPLRTQPEIYKNDLQNITKRLRSWLQDEYPILVPILDQELQACQ